MTTNMLVHDMRLQGRSPRVDGTLLEVTAMDRIQDIADKSAKVARDNQRIRWYAIMAHGMGEVSADKGGSQGIALGEGLTADNVKCFKTLRDAKGRGLVDRIVLYACSVGNHSAWSDRTYGDGAWLCTRLSVVTQAKVIASSWDQAYHPNLDVPDGTIDFGEWEGEVFEFTPDGKKRKLEDWEKPRQFVWTKAPAPATP